MTTVQREKESSMTTPEFQDGPEEESGPRREELAEDLGIAGRKFLTDDLDDDVRAAVGRVLTERLGEFYVLPKDLRGLSPYIDEEFAQLHAKSISLSLAANRIRKELDGTRSPIGHTDLQQVLGGTSMATYEALAALAYAVGSTTGKIIQEANDRRWERED